MRDYCNYRFLKAFKVILFFIGALAALAAACCFFPDEGLEAGPFTLRLPKKDDLLKVATSARSDEPSPEDLLRMQMEALRAEQEKDFLDYFQNSPSRFYFPDDNPEYFDLLFESLDSASVHPMRIMYYGDSQLEEDRMTVTLRKMLQTRFGGLGVGYLPFNLLYPTMSTTQWRSYDPPRALVHATKEFRVADGKFGPIGQAARVSYPITVKYAPFSSKAPFTPARCFRKVTVITDTTAVPMTVEVEGSEVLCDTTHNALKFYTAEMPDSVMSARIQVRGSGDIYGVMLDGDEGVSVDNIALRSSNGLFFTKLNAGQLKDFYNRANVRLLILQYGTNVVGAVGSDAARSNYGQRFRDQILYLKEVAPDARILVIGPMDMAPGGKTYSYTSKVVDTVRTYTLEAGAAYWDLYQVMGGQNSIYQWVESGLTGPDYVHYSRKGADKVAELLGNSLMFYYDYYKWRKY